MHNTLSKKILEAHEVSTLKPVRSKLLLIPENIASQYEIVPFDGEKMTLALLTTNTYSENLKTIYEGLKKAGYTPDIYYTDPEGIKMALSRYHQLAQREQEELEEQKKKQEAQGINAIDQILALYPQRGSMDPGDFLMQVLKFSFQAGASDLHFQVQSEHILLRLRIDGVLQTVCVFDHNEYTAYMQKIKFRGGLKMNVSATPQDGRMSFELGTSDKKSIDVRINTMPGLDQLENIVLRFLDSKIAVHSFEDIGFRGTPLRDIDEILGMNEGMVLVTGPTGSGKTTTLYTMLQRLNTGKTKIVTLEDPIEYKIDGIEQSQINYSQGYTFEKGLEAILRHDPDIILVGETRSAETAKTALNAALTGHLVFSTLHTTSALDAIPRLLMMGIEAYLLAPALQAIIAQRLVRKVCSNCASLRTANDHENEFILKQLNTIRQVRPDIEINYTGEIVTASGCDACNGTGYSGRMAIVELLMMTTQIREKIVDKGENVAEIMSLMRKNGFLTMQEDALIKMLSGQTTIEELRRVI